MVSSETIVSFMRNWINAKSLVNEVFCVLTVNAKGVPVSFGTVAKGGVASAGVDLTILFKYVILSPGGVGFMVVHNHPSGRPEPSAEDLALTKRIAAGAHTLGLSFIDHVILTGDGHFSFVDSPPNKNSFWFC